MNEHLENFLPPKPKKREPVKYGQPQVLTAELLASWRIRLPKTVWASLKDDPRLTSEQAITIVNILSEKFPREWRLHKIGDDGKIWVVKYPLDMPPNQRVLN